MSTDIEYMSTEIRSAREAATLFKILGIKDITTERQRKNGTTVYELPMQRAYPGTSYPIRFATYEAGYVRNVSEDNSSPYQINKTKKYKPLNEYQHGYTERILIPKWEDRLIYLAKFIIKNYYKKPTYLISDYTMDTMKSQYRQAVKYRNLTECDKIQADVNATHSLPFAVDVNVDDIKVVINGHRYNLS